MTDTRPEQGPRFADREPHQPGTGRARPAYPLYELTVPAVRALDRLATERFGIPPIVLMENAARELREQALALLDIARDPAAVILCGPGNNGGDGLALARHLANLGIPVRIVLLTDPTKLSPDAATNLRIVQAMGIPVTDPTADLPEAPGLVIDALFGTGLTRPVEGEAVRLVEWAQSCRSAGSLILAVDVPSGLDATSGEPLGTCCVRADRTLTLAAMKPGLTRLEAQPYVGDVTVGDIGAPVSLLAELGKPWEGFRWGIGVSEGI